MRRIFKKLNNKAFTLIEILLAVAVLAIATVSIGAIVMSTQNNTAKMFSEAELQQQLVEAQATLHDEVLGTNTGIKYWVREGKDSFWELSDRDVTAYEKIVAFYNLDIKDYVLTKTYYKWNSEDKILLVGTLNEEVPKLTDTEIIVDVDPNPSTTFAQIEKWSTVAAQIENFSFSVENYNKNRLVSFAFDIKQGDSVYPADDTIYLRNDININTELQIEKYHTILLDKPVLTGLAYTYDGREHAPLESNFLSRYMKRVDGSTTSATNAGTYTVTYRLLDKDATQWADGTTADITYTWSIAQRAVGVVWGDDIWVYDGQKHSTTCSLTNVVDGTDPGLVLKNNSVGPNVGTVTCTATLTNANYKFQAGNTVVLEIYPQTSSATVIGIDRTYNGSAQTMTVSSNITGGVVQYYISKSSSAPSISNVNNSKCEATDAGSYHVWYKIKATSGNYSDSDIVYLGKVTMQRSPTATVGSNDLVYNTSVQHGVTGQYIVLTGSYSAKDAGTYTAYATPDSNHLWADGTSIQKTLTWTMKKAVGQVTAPTAKTLTYNGTEQILINAGSTDFGQVMYKLGSNGSWSTSLPKATNAGTYTIFYYSTGDSNHEPTVQTTSITVTIARAKTAKYSSSDFTYDTKEKTGVTGTNVVIEGVSKATNANTYTAYVTPAENYAWSDGTIGQKTVKWIIHKANGAITAPTAKTLTYNGKAQALINAGSTPYGSVYYKLNNGSWSTDIPTATEAGTYKIYYYSSGNSNYNPTSQDAYISVTIAKSSTATVVVKNRTYNSTNQYGYSTATDVNLAGDYQMKDAGTYTFTATPKTNFSWSDGTTETKTFTWTMNKANGSVTAPTAKTLTYNGSSQTLINAGSTPYGSVYYKIGDNGAWSTSLPKATTAGTYKIYYYSNGDANHKATSQSAYITVTISRNNISSVTVVNRTYTGSAQNGYSAKSKVVLSGDYQKTNAGTYTFKAVPEDNYAWTDGTIDEKTFTYVIDKATGSVTAPTAKSLTYNTKAQALVNAGATSWGKIYYKLDNGSWSETIPTATNAGTYKVYYYSSGDANHYPTSQSSYINVTISLSKTAVVEKSDRTYNGSAQNGYSIATDVNLTGDYSKTNAGTYVFKATPKTNYAWKDDGTTSERTFTWIMNPNPIAYVTVANRTWTGSAQNGYSAKDYVTLSGDYSKSDAGTYTFTATPNANYAWTDKTTSSKTFKWTMAPKADASITKADRTYTGSAQNGYSSKANVDLSGTYSATNSGSYTYTATPSKNHAWSDGTTTGKTITWTLGLQKTASLTQSSDFTYDGTTKCGYTAQTNVDITGASTATNAGTYTFKATPKANYAWSDGTTKTITYTWTINRQKTATASSSNHVYTGGQLTGVTGKNVTWTGDTSATVVGTYTAYATPESNYAWSDGTYAKKTLTWKITTKNDASITKSDRTYTGSNQYGYSSKANVVLSGDYYKSAAGTYSYTATPSANHAWSDGTTTAKTITWTMNKAAGACSAPTAKTLTYTGSVQTLINAGSTSYGSMYYKLDNGSWSTSLPSATNAGTYKVYYYSSGDANHNATSQSAYITVTIGNSKTAVVAKTDRTYTGSAQNGYTTATNVNLSGDYSKTAAGSYTYYATPKTNYAWKDDGTTTQRTFTWTMNKQASAVVTKTDRTYTGSAQNGYTTATNVNLSGDYSKTVAGSYTYYATPKTNYAWKDDGTTTQRTFTWTMNKAPGSYTAPTAKSLTYNGSAQTLINAGSSSTGTMYYKLGNGSYSTSLPQATSAGTYTVYYYLKGDSNHNDTAEQSIAVTIAKKAGSCTAPTAKSLTYNGSAQTLINAGSSSTGTMYYKVGSGSWSTSLPSATNAGTYTVYYYSKGNNNHNDTSTGSLTVTIAKKAGSCTAPTAKSLTYNGSAQTLINAGSSSTGTMYYKLDNGSWSTGLPSAVNAGTYKVYYYSKGNSNHNDTSTSAYITVTIAKKAGSCTAPTAKSLTYTGSAQTLINAGSSSTGTMYYALPGEYYSTSLPSATNAGTYTVYYYSAGDANHNNTSAGSIQVTIGKAAGSCTAPTAKSLTYNGSAQTLINAGSSSTGTMYYALPGEYYSTSLPSATNAGTYTVYYYSAGDANHNNTSAGSIQVTISRLACCTVSLANRTYNGYAQSGYSSYCSHLTNWTGTWSATNAGTYTFYCEPDSNHLWSDGTSGTKALTWYMYKAAGSCTAPTAKSLNYTGGAQTLINAGSSSTGTMYYALAGGSYSTSLPTATAAGTYTVYYYSAGDANHNDTSVGSIQVTIVGGFMVGSHVNATGAQKYNSEDKATSDTERKGAFGSSWYSAASMYIIKIAGTKNSSGIYTAADANKASPLLGTTVNYDDLIAWARFDQITLN